MGKKGSWLSAVKRALGPESKEKKDKKIHHSKKRWFGRQKCLDTCIPPVETASVIPVPPPPPPPRSIRIEEATRREDEAEQSQHAYSVAVATAVAAEAASAAAQAAAEVVRLTNASFFLGKSKEEIAAIRIQTAFRSYLARRTFRALRGLARLKLLIKGQSVKRQTENTLRCMQSLARVQSQIHTRRLRMSEENQALQRQLLQKHEKEAEKLRVSNGDNWNASAKSKEEAEAKLQHKQEAAMRRERALAYAHSHQQTWRNSSKPANQTFMDTNNPYWGWSWLERWLATRPWETRSITTDTSLDTDLAPLKIPTSRSITDDNLSPASKKTNNSPRRQSPSTTPKARSPSTTPKAQSPTFRKTKTSSPRGNATGLENDSTKNRRHSLPSSSVRHNEGNANSTKSTNARTRLPSPLGMVPDGTPKKQSTTSSAQKRLSFSSSSVGVRRYSGPPRVDTSSPKDIAVQT